MKENDWTKEIAEEIEGKLKEQLGENICVSTFVEVPYSYKINGFDSSWSIDKKNCDSSEFQVDLIIYEKDNNKMIPRVIVESKVESITTHDAITYSHKANLHKAVMPYIRYGIMCGNIKQLPIRAFKHGTAFDFLFSFSCFDPTTQEMNEFIDMLKKEIAYSQQIQEILNTSMNRNRKKYHMIQKGLVIK